MRILQSVKTLLIFTALATLFSGCTKVVEKEVFIRVPCEVSFIEQYRAIDCSTLADELEFAKCDMKNILASETDRKNFKEEVGACR